MNGHSKQTIAIYCSKIYFCQNAYGKLNIFVLLICQVKCMQLYRYMRKRAKSKLSSISKGGNQHSITKLTNSEMYFGYIGYTENKMVPKMTNINLFIVTVLNVSKF